MGTWGLRGHSWTRASRSLTPRALRSEAANFLLLLHSNFFAKQLRFQSDPKLLGNTSLQQTSKRNKLTEIGEKIMQKY